MLMVRNLRDELLKNGYFDWTKAFDWSLSGLCISILTLFKYWVSQKLPQIFTASDKV